MSERQGFTPALDQYGELRQYKSALDYAVQFRKIANKFSFNDAFLMEMFYRGLKENVKDEICKNDRPDKLEDYIAMAIRIDDRLYARRIERRLQR